jgi:hypothetical protein
MGVEMGIEMEKGSGMDVIKEMYTDAENRESSEEENKLTPSQSEQGVEGNMQEKSNEGVLSE